MRCSVIFCFVLLLAAFPASSQVKAEKNKINRKVRKQIVMMHEGDQFWRWQCAAEGSDYQKSPACKKTTEIDWKNTRELQKIIKRYGFPTEDVIGADVIGNVYTIVIHSPSIEFQKESLPFIEEAAAGNPQLKPEVALLTDKILVAEGKPQLYGTQFKFENGKAFLRETAAPETLDERRAQMLLPPMSEYVKMLEKIYKMPVVNPSDGKKQTTFPKR